MAKPLVLPGLVLRLLTLNFCTVSLQVTWQSMKLRLRIIVKTPYKYENLTSNEEVDHAVNLNMCKRSQQCVLDPFGDWDSH